VIDARVHDEQLEPGILEPQLDHLGVEGAAVEEDPVIAASEEGRTLVHDAGRCADGLVLGELPDAGERRSVEAELPLVVQSDGDSAHERRRR